MLKRLILCILLLVFCIVPTLAQDAEAGYQEALRRIEATRVSEATELDLSSLGLTELPPEIGQLTKLQLFHVFNNRLTHLPPEIGQLTNLQLLSLFHNQLTSLPSEISHLTNLQLLSLDNNQLTSLPSEIGYLTDLQILSVTSNQLSALPSEIGQLIHLRSLYLDNNQLASLPHEISQLASLKKLYIAHNQLTTLPIQLGQLSELNSLSTSLLTFPPPEITSQGTAATLAYLRDYEAMLIRQTIAGIAAGMGVLAAGLLVFRGRQRHRLGEKKKRL